MKLTQATKAHFLSSGAREFGYQTVPNGHVGYFYFKFSHPVTEAERDHTRELMEYVLASNDLVEMRIKGPDQMIVYYDPSYYLPRYSAGVVRFRDVSKYTGVKS